MKAAGLLFVCSWRHLSSIQVDEVLLFSKRNTTFKIIGNILDQPEGSFSMIGCCVVAYQITHFWADRGKVV